MPVLAACSAAQPQLPQQLLWASRRSATENQSPNHPVYCADYSPLFLSFVASTSVPYPALTHHACCRLSSLLFLLLQAVTQLYTGILARSSTFHVVV
jgi:hypothetical protein